MTRDVQVRPPGTAWLAVFGGWLATIGATVLIAPLVAGVLSSMNLRVGGLGPAVPFLVGVFVSYLIGGYVAGRMAGYRTSWHGMLAAFFTLLVFLVVGLLAYAANVGIFVGLGVSGLGDYASALGGEVDASGNALTFGLLLGFLIAIFAGWLGGVLAPSHPAVPVPAVTRAPAATAEGAHARSAGASERTVARERRPVPSLSRKGGEREPEPVETESGSEGVTAG